MTSNLHAQALGLYIHIPYCVHHCVYCDFNVRVLEKREWIGTYLAGLHKEIRHRGSLMVDTHSVDSIFLGGGTPSLLSPQQLSDLLNVVRTSFEVSRDVEVTMEANPNSLAIDKLDELSSAGINRFSVGVQTFNKKHLKTLERIHSSQEALRAIDALKRSGISFNVDFIFGIPSQTLAEFKEDIQAVLSFSPPHLSTYHLSVGSTNRLFSKLPPDDVSAEMYEWVIQTLPKYGYEHYEVSAFAKPGESCRHNLKYWKMEDYLGVGAGSSSRLRTEAHPWGIHMKNVNRIERYLEATNEARLPLAENEPLSESQAIKDYLMMRFRLLEGVSLAAFEARFHKSLMISYKCEIERLKSEGLLDSSPEMLTLSAKGLLYLNRVLLAFM